MRDARPESAKFKRPTTAVRKRPSSGLGGAKTQEATNEKKVEATKPQTLINKTSIKIFEIHPVIKELNFLRKPKCLLDPLGDRFEFVKHSQQQMRGNMPYNPPIGWTRYGLNIKMLYPSIDEWLAKDSNAKEWAVGYRGFAVKLRFLKKLENKNNCKNV